jgi:hypothetical protein
LYGEKNENRSTIQVQIQAGASMLACRGSSLHTLSHKTTVANLSLSNRWSLIRPDPVRWRKGRMCNVAPVTGIEAGNPLPTCPDLWYPLFSPTNLRRGRAFDPCSLPQQIPPAAALLLTSRRPSGTASSGTGLAPLSNFPRHCM